MRINRIFYLVSTIAASFFALQTHAQKIEITAHFYGLLEKAGLEFFEPLEAGYRDIKLPKNDFQNCDLAIRSNKEDLEIRYVILPWDENDPTASLPNVAAFRTVTNVASNLDNTLISAIQPEAGTIKVDFNADWGMTYFFEPKKGFSDWPYCRLVALHKKEKGTVFVFYLFDNTENEALDMRYLALRFLD